MSVKNRFVRVMIINALYSVASNMVHPVTPTLITSLGLPDRMFGWFFAAMAVGNLLFSALWGRMADKRGRRIVVLLTLLGYALGQAFFGFSGNGTVMLIARLFGGSMTGGTSAAILASVVDASDAESRTSNLSIYAAVMSVFSAMGYFLGGMLGMISLPVDFIAHVVMLVLCAVLTWIILPDTVRPEVSVPDGQRMNLKTIMGIMTLPMALFFIGVIFANFSTYGYDNAFNYYIKREMGFPSSANGIIKAATGLIGLAVNLTINRWIAKRFEGNRAMMTVFLLCAATLFTACFMEQAVLFIGMNIVFYAFNAMYVPIQQSLMAQDRSADYGLLSGMYTTAKAVGMIAGALSAGYLYEIQPTLPFFTQVIGFVLAAAVTLLGIFVAKRKAA